jgi:phospholipase/carboxylesterase
MTTTSTPFRRQRPVISPDTVLVVLLHGVGSSGDAMNWMAEGLKAKFPTMATFAPDAPQRFDMASSGYQWFSIVGVTESNRAERVQEANAELVARIEAEQRRLEIDWDRTAVVGFSQGAMLALSMAATLDPAPGLVAGLSGRVALPLAPGRTARRRVFLSHGTADPVVPFAEMERAGSFLRSQGCEVEVLEMRGQGHSVAMKQMIAITGSLERTFLFDASQIQARHP